MAGPGLRPQPWTRSRTPARGGGGAESRAARPLPAAAGRTHVASAAVGVAPRGREMFTGETSRGACGGLAPLSKISSPQNAGLKMLDAARDSPLVNSVYSHRKQISSDSLFKHSQGRFHPEHRENCGCNPGHQRWPREESPALESNRPAGCPVR